MLALRMGRGAARSRIGARTVRLVIMVLVATSGLAGCAQGGKGAPPSPPAEGQSGTAPTTAASPAPPSATQSSAAPVLEDGPHVAYLTGLNVPGRTITFDLIEFLTGEAANKACVDHQGPECPPPNDYFIVNDNPKLRTLPVSENVQAKVLASGGVTPIPIDFSDLPGHFASTKTDKLLSHLPFRLTVAQGTVVALEEIYLP